MGQGVLGNMQVCFGLSLPGYFEGLHIYGAGSTDWQLPSSKIYTSGRRLSIKPVDTGSLKICLGSGDKRFGEYGSCWAELDVRKSNRERLVKNNFQIPV